MKEMMEEDIDIIPAEDLEFPWIWVLLVVVMCILFGFTGYVIGRMDGRAEGIEMQREATRELASPEEDDEQSIRAGEPEATEGSRGP
jgi:hypothetical protein